MKRSRNVNEMRRAAQIMDRNRSRLTVHYDWRSVDEVRKWRDARRP